MEEQDTFEQSRNSVLVELGSFNVEFEHVTHNFKSCIESILINNGLKERKFASCLTGKLTADPIKTIFQSIIKYYTNTDEDKEKINYFIRLFSDLIEIRNIIIHCCWTIGEVCEPREPFILGTKEKISKKGAGLYRLDLKIEELKLLNDELYEFSALTFNLWEVFSENGQEFGEIDIEKIKSIDFNKHLKKFSADS